MYLSVYLSTCPSDSFFLLVVLSLQLSVSTSVLLPEGCLALGRKRGKDSESEAREGDVSVRLTPVRDGWRPEGSFLPFVMASESPSARGATALGSRLTLLI